MKKILFIFTLLITAFTSKAIHVLGGEITWECNGNQEYIFQLVLYNDCSDGAITASTQAIMWSGGASISCAFDTSYIISPTCGNGNYSIICDSTVFYTPVRRYVYRSAPTVLLGTIPSVGWQFWHAEQARPNTDNLTGGGGVGYTLRAMMRPYLINGVVQSPTNCYDNSPKFNETPRYAFNTDSNFFYVDGYEIDNRDSTHFAWAEPLDYALATPGVPVPFEPGYAFNQPLPGPIVNSGNSGATLFNNGLLAFKSVTLGRFTTCYKIESYRNGQLIAEVFRDFEIQLNSDPGSPGICGGPSNNVPAISLNAVAGFNTLHPVFENGVITHYTMSLFAGETVNFTVTAQDVDLSPSCTPQTISVNVQGDAISQSFLGTNDCDGAPCANLISLNSGGGYTSSLSNTVRLQWVTDTTHAFGPNGFGTHWFHFSFKDDHCVLPGIGETKVLVTVLRPIYAPISHYKICAGDTAFAEVLGENTNLVWSPTTGISCANCANPKFYPTTTTTYTATDTASTFSLEIVVEVDTPAAIPSLTQSGANLLLANPSAYDTVVWRVNGAPFYPQPINTYTPWLSGNYWVEGASGVCAASSDTFSFEFANNLSAVASKNGQQNNLEHGSKTYGTTIRLGLEPFYRIDGFYLHAFDKNAQGANVNTLKCKIYNQSQAVVFESDSVTRFSNEDLKFHGEYNLSSAEDYLIAFYVDTSVIVPTFAPVVWPVVASGGRVLVYNATKVNGNFYPAVSATEYPFYHFSLKWGVGVEEELLSGVAFYPNPANDVLVLTSSAEASFKLMNGLGKVVAAGNIKNEFRQPTAQLTSGIYVIEFALPNGLVKRDKVVITH